MNDTPVLILGLVIFAAVLGSTWLGIKLGRRTRTDQAPESDHLGTIQGALIGLLGLVLSFSFGGAMSRFIDRQDALAREANAIETAYERAPLVPNAELIRARLRTYAAARLKLTHEYRAAASQALEDQLEKSLAAARDQAIESARQLPQQALLVLQGIENVGDEFARRNAILRRHLPYELISVLFVCSCAAMSVIGYGVGLAQRRSTVATYTLASLVAVTLFVTLDFDRPRQGLIRLDATPLEETTRKLGAN